MGRSMARRTWLQLMAGVALSGVRLSAFQAPRRDRVVVAGAGIIGANIAYRLARRGAAVTLLDRSAPGTGTTANSFAWINAKKSPRPYHTLSAFGIEAWRVLDQELHGELPLVWGGSLEWITEADRAARLVEVNRQYQSWGYPVRAIDAAGLTALEPHVRVDGLRQGFHAETEASVDPQGAAEGDRRARHGRRGDRAAPVDGDRARRAGRALARHAHVDRRRRGRRAGDRLRQRPPALAALAGIEVPLTRSAGVLVHTAPQPPAIGHVVLSPLGQIKQKRNGRFVTGADFGPAKSEDTSMATGEQFLQRMAAVLRPWARRRSRS